MTVSAYPLTWPQGWPRTFGVARKSAQFKKYKNQLSVADGMVRVLEELEHLRIKRDDVVVSTNIRTRLDGFPRSDQSEPTDPGVAVYWEDKDGKTKVMAIDRYTRVADNLAAIAATLEAMRAIERHGGGQILERAFTGFTALPAPPNCWDILGLTPGSSAERVRAKFRELVNLHHPDKEGGSTIRFQEIIAARDEALKQAAA